MKIVVRLFFLLLPVCSLYAASGLVDDTFSFQQRRMSLLLPQAGERTFANAFVLGLRRYHLQGNIVQIEPALMKLFKRLGSSLPVSDCVSDLPLKGLTNMRIRQWLKYLDCHLAFKHNQKEREHAEEYLEDHFSDFRYVFKKDNPSADSACAEILALLRKQASGATDLTGVEKSLELLGKNLDAARAHADAQEKRADLATEKLMAASSANGGLQERVKTLQEQLKQSGILESGKLNEEIRRLEEELGLSLAKKEELQTLYAGVYNECIALREERETLSKDYERVLGEVKGLEAAQSKERLNAKVLEAAQSKERLNAAEIARLTGLREASLQELKKALQEKALVIAEKRVAESRIEYLNARLKSSADVGRLREEAEGLRESLQKQMLLAEEARINFTQKEQTLQSKQRKIEQELALLQAQSQDLQKTLSAKEEKIKILQNDKENMEDKLRGYRSKGAEMMAEVERSVRLQKKLAGDNVALREESEKLSRELERERAEKKVLMDAEQTCESLRERQASLLEERNELERSKLALIESEKKGQELLEASRSAEAKLQEEVHLLQKNQESIRQDRVDSDEKQARLTEDLEESRRKEEELLQDSEKDSQRFKEEIEQLQNEKKCVLQEKFLSEGKVIDLEKKLREVQDEREQFLASKLTESALNEALKQECARLKSEQSKISEESDALHAQVERLEQELAQKLDNIQILKKEAEQLKEEQESMLREKASAEESILIEKALAEEKINDLQQKVEQLYDERTTESQANHACEEKILNLEEDLESFRQKEKELLQNAQHMREELQARELQEKENTEHQTRTVDSLISQVKDLERVTAEQTEGLEQQAREIVHLQEGSGELEAASSEKDKLIEGLREQIKSVETTCQLLTAEYHKSHEQLHKSEAELAEALSERQLLEGELAEAKDEGDKLQQELEENDTLLESERHDHERLKKDMLALQKELEDTQSQVEREKMQSAQVGNAVRSKEEGIKELVRKEEALKAEILEMKGKTRDSEKTIEQMKQDQILLTERLEEQEALNTQLSREKSVTQMEIQDRKSRLQELEESVTQFAEKEASLNKKIFTLQEKLNKKTKRMSEAEEGMAETTRVMVAAGAEKEKLVEKVVSLESQISTLEEFAAQQKQEQNLLAEKLEERAALNAQLSHDKEEAQRESEEAKNHVQELEESTKKFMEEEARLNKKIAQLQEKLRKKNECLSQVEQSMVDTSRVMNDAREEKEELTRRIATLEEEIERQKTRMEEEAQETLDVTESAKKKIALDLEKALEQQKLAETNISKLNATKKALVDALATSDGKVQALEKVKEELQSKEGESQSRVEALRQEKESMESKMQNLEQRLLVLKKESETTRQALVSLKDMYDQMGVAFDIDTSEDVDPAAIESMMEKIQNFADLEQQLSSSKVAFRQSMQSKSKVEQELADEKQNCAHFQRAAMQEEERRIIQEAHADKLEADVAEKDAELKRCSEELAAVRAQLTGSAKHEGASSKEEPDSVERRVKDAAELFEEVKEFLEVFLTEHEKAWTQSMKRQTRLVGEGKFSERVTQDEVLNSFVSERSQTLRRICRKHKTASGDSCQRSLMSLHEQIIKVCNDIMRKYELFHKAQEDQLQRERDERLAEEREAQRMQVAGEACVSTMSHLTQSALGLEGSRALLGIKTEAVAELQSIGEKLGKSFSAPITEFLQDFSLEETGDVQKDIKDIKRLIGTFGLVMDGYIQASKKKDKVGSAQSKQVVESLAVDSEKKQQKLNEYKGQLKEYKAQVTTLLAEKEDLTVLQSDALARIEELEETLKGLRLRVNDQSRRLSASEKDRQALLANEEFIEAHMLKMSQNTSTRPISHSSEPQSDPTAYEGEGEEDVITEVVNIQEDTLPLMTT